MVASARTANARICQRTNKSTSRFQRTDDTHQVTLARHCPSQKGMETSQWPPGGKRNGGTPTLLGCCLQLWCKGALVPRPRSHPCFSPGLPKTPERHWETSKPEADARRRTRQARLEITRLSARKLLTVKGRPAQLQCSRSKAAHTPTPR